MTERQQPSMLQEAGTYAHKGLSVFPCKEKIPLTGKGGFKHATCDALQIAKWWTEHPNAQIGLRTGEVNHLFVIDVDGPEAVRAVEKMHLPETFTVVTRPGRYQFWFRQPDSMKSKCSASVLAPQVDTRGDGGYVIAPPSIHHATGQPYSVLNDVPWAPAPIFLLNPHTTPVSHPPTLDAIPQGQRHRTLLSIAGALRARGLSPEMVLSQLRIVNERQCDPPIEDSELQKLANFVGNKPAGFSGQRTETCAELNLLYYHQIEREQVRWLWHNRVPRGKLTLFVGDPGTGKSLATIDLAARVSSGRAFPDGCACDRGDVLILTAEDDAKDTVGPRLDAAGADSAHVARINAVQVTLADGATGESNFSLERDLGKLEEALAKRPGFKLIIIDPLTAYMGTKINSWRDSDVRSLLAPLMDFSGRTGIASVGIMHMRKSETDAMLRVSGSIAFVAAARTVWGFGEDPEDAKKRVMVPVKNNLAALGNALGYQITANGDGVPYITWQKEPRAVDAEDVLGGSKKEKRERSEKRGEAEEWLRAKLSDGATQQEQLKTEAEKAGISYRTLFRAKSLLGVRSHKAGMGGSWYWELPEDCQQGGQSVSP